jgi:hypothetical protein
MMPWERLKEARKEAEKKLGKDVVDLIEDLVNAIIDDHEWKDPDDDR